MSGRRAAAGGRGDCPGPLLFWACRGRTGRRAAALAARRPHLPRRSASRRQSFPWGTRKPCPCGSVRPGPGTAAVHHPVLAHSPPRRNACLAPPCLWGRCGLFEDRGCVAGDRIGSFNAGKVVSINRVSISKRRWPLRHGRGAPLHRIPHRRISQPSSIVAGAANLSTTCIR